MAKAEACLSTNSAITVTDLNTTVNCEPRVHDLRLAEALGFSDRHMIRALIRRHLPVLRSFGEVSTERKKPSGRGGRPGTDYYLNKRQALFVTAKSDTERAALVTVQMVEVFDQVTGGQVVPVKAHRRKAPALSSPAASIGPDDLGAVMIEGALVRFAAGRHPEPGHLAVVIRSDGKLAVLSVSDQGPDRARQARPGFVMVDVPVPGDRRIRTTREQATLVGAVVKNASAKRASAPLMPGRLSARIMRTYASWLHMEYARLREEIERSENRENRLPGIGLEITNPGYRTCASAPARPR